MRLAFLGDIMLGRGVNEVMASRPPEWLWGDTLELLAACDVRIGNLECAVSERGEPWDRTPKVFHFRAHPRAVDVLRAAGIDAVSAANNHALDYGYEALVDTLDQLDAARIARAGAGRDIVEARRPVPVGGDPPVVLCAWTDNEPPFAAGDDRPGTNRFNVGDETLFAQLEAAGKLTEDPLVVVSAHWGPNMVERPPPEHRSYAQKAAERGARIWHGHSAHIPQGAEFVRAEGGTALVLYDTGDAIDDYAVDDRLRNDLSLLFVVETEGREPVRLEATPLKLSLGRVDRAVGDEARWMAERFAGLCEELGQAASLTEDRTVVCEP